MQVLKKKEMYLGSLEGVRVGLLVGSVVDGAGARVRVIDVVVELVAHGEKRVVARGHGVPLGREGHLVRERVAAALLRVLARGIVRVSLQLI